MGSQSFQKRGRRVRIRSPRDQNSGDTLQYRISPLIAQEDSVAKNFGDLRDLSTRWVATHDLAEWKDEIAWMSQYFSAAVWASLALCVCYSPEDYLSRYRRQATAAARRKSCSPRGRDF
jgi:hypothetical protein